MNIRGIVDAARSRCAGVVSNRIRCPRGRRTSAERVGALSGQISQHYIYNSLQSIRGLCDTDPDRAKAALDAFSEYLRGNLENLTTETLIPFARELEITQAYLELEKLTGDRLFKVEYRLEATDFMLPPLVLQPLVENAVKHGAKKAASDPEPGDRVVTQITVSTFEKDGNICIEVTDSTEAGESADAADALTHAGSVADLYNVSPETANNRKKKKSVGLQNIRARLEIICGGTLELKSTYSGTKAIIILPVSSQAKP